MDQICTKKEKKKPLIAYLKFKVNGMASISFFFFKLLSKFNNPSSKPSCQFQFKIKGLSLSALVLPSLLLCV